MKVMKNIKKGAILLLSIFLIYLGYWSMLHDSDCGALTFATIIVGLIIHLAIIQLTNQ